MRSSRFLTATVLAGVAICGACGSSSGPSAAAHHEFVETRAAALCTVKAHAFPNEAALAKAYSSASKSNLTAADARALQTQADHDESLRAEISARVASLCP